MKPEKSQEKNKIDFSCDYSNDFIEWRKPTPLFDGKDELFEDVLVQQDIPSPEKIEEEISL